MERKIGEIFEYNGEWYQCVEGYHCYDCDFRHENGSCIIDANYPESKMGNCNGDYRPDNQNVVFKNLKKIGEPVTVKGRTFQKLTSDNNSCKECVFNVPNKACCKNSYIEGICDDNGFWIEIKQTKEDMEENKTPLPKEDNNLTRTVYNYVNGKISDKELIKSIKEMSDEYPYDKNNLKPFSLELAKQGKPVCTKDGRKARIICFDRKGKQPIIALVTQDNGEEFIENYHLSGRFNVDATFENNNDLMMLPEKKEGWINVYRLNTCYKTKEEAEANIDRDYEDEYVRTVKINWEE